jgi:site-specific DNA-methyltransferase (adenine-specific)
LLPELIERGEKFDAIIIDPPYNIGYDSWDDFDIDKAVKYCSQLLKENGNFICFQGWSNVCKTKLTLDKYFKIQNWIVWDRIKGRGTKKQLVSTREDILWYCNGDNPTFNKIYSNTPKKTKGMGSKNGQENRALTNVWYDISPIVPWSKERNLHPTQKPLQLMERIITIFTNEDDRVLDFCMGSGTTGVACKNLDRDFYGNELIAEYYAIAESRIVV